MSLLYIYGISKNISQSALRYWNTEQNSVNTLKLSSCLYFVWMMMDTFTYTIEISLGKGFFRYLQIDYSLIYQLKDHLPSNVKKVNLTLITQAGKIIRDIDHFAQAPLFFCPEYGQLLIRNYSVIYENISDTTLNIMISNYYQTNPYAFGVVDFKLKTISHSLDKGCSSGYYLDFSESSPKCLRCSSFCWRCTNENSCTECEPTYLLRGESCFLPNSN